MAKVALILSGCGYLDGSEIHETVFCLLALAEAGHSYHSFAPDRPQAKVVNHLTQEAVPGESRNCMVEAARIARGAISPLEKLVPGEWDALLMPGGFGVVCNLSDFATKGTHCTVNKKLTETLQEFHSQKKSIGATCISPALLAKVFEGRALLTLTLGQSDANAQLEEMGMKSVAASSSDAVVDEANRVYTTPCYMEPPDLPAMLEGIRKVVSHLR